MHLKERPDGRFHFLPAAGVLSSTGRDRPFVLLETGLPSRTEYHSYLFLNPVDTVTAFRPEEASHAFERLDEAAGNGLWAAGFLSYELGYYLEPSLRPRYEGHSPLLWFGLFESPFIFDHLQGTFSPALPFPLPDAPPRPSFTIAEGTAGITEEEYRRAVASIKDRIARGDTYQVNFTMKYRFPFQGSPEGLYLSLRDSQPVPFAAFLRTGERDILSASPELFFRREGADISVRPMKGTMSRGRTTEEDRRQAERLAADEKNRAENVMIVDLMRNDLGRICLPGSIDVTDIYRVERYDTLMQMTSTVRGRLRGDPSRRDMIQALFPCGSVTGAPKIRTMEIIGELEKEERGVYCGAVGFFAPQGNSTFSVPIRTVVLEGDRGEMGIGSGIVADSEAGMEYEECLLKARFLTNPRPPLRLIETMLWKGREGFLHLEDHLTRMASSAEYFRFFCPLPDIRRSLEESSSRFAPHEDRRVRILLSRDGRWETSSSPLDPIANRPLPVRLADIPVDSEDPCLYHKTTRRERYDRELSEAREKGIFEVIFINERGEVTEGSFTNLFLQRAGRLVTPPVDCGLLDGILRRTLLRRGQAFEEVLFPRDLKEASRLYVGNSVRGLLEVSLDKKGDRSIFRRVARSRDSGGRE